MSSVPSIVLVHGAWCSPKVFEPLLPYLSSYKEVLAPALPSVGCAPDSESMKTWRPDIEAASSAILKALSQSKKVVVVSHSYAGIVVSEALQYVPIPDRSRVRHICLQGVMVDVGQMVVLDPTQPPPPTWRVVDGLCYAGNPKETLFNDLEEEEKERWEKELNYIPDIVAYQPLTYAAQYDFETTYVISNDDRCLPAEVQEMIVAAANEKGANVKAERLDCGHMSFLRMPDQVAGIIRKIADDDQWQV